MKKYLAIIPAAAVIVGLLTFVLLRKGSVGNADGVRVFTFRSDGVSFSGGSADYEIDGTQVTITGSGEYVLTGSCADGSVAVKKNVTDVTLILRDLELRAAKTAPILLKKNSQTEIRVEGVCTLTDAEENENDDSFEGAAIKAKAGAALRLTGDGALQLAGNAGDALKGAAESSVIIDGPRVTVTAVKDGVSCDGEITILGGLLDVTAENDGIKASPDDDASLGKVTILSGTLRLTVGDDAIHADSALTVGSEGADEGPDITVFGCCEGLEGTPVLLHSGKAVIKSEDDAINAGGGGENAIFVTGGSWYADSEGDGFDANGEIRISGGLLEIYGAENGSGKNTALDADTGVTVTGGSILAVDTDGTEPAGVRVRFKGLNLQNGSTLEIRSAEGRTIRTGVARKSANTVLLAGDGIAEGDIFKLFVDGAETASAVAESGGYIDHRFDGGFGKLPEEGATPPDFANGERPQDPGAGEKPTQDDE